MWRIWHCRTSWMKNWVSWVQKVGVVYTFSRQIGHFWNQIDILEASLLKSWFNLKDLQFGFEIKLSIFWIKTGVFRIKLEILRKITFFVRKSWPDFLWNFLIYLYKRSHIHHFLSEDGCGTFTEPRMWNIVVRKPVIIFSWRHCKIWFLCHSFLLEEIWVQFLSDPKHLCRVSHSSLFWDCHFYLSVRFLLRSLHSP